jgi:GxxExxY protein
MPLEQGELTGQIIGAAIEAHRRLGPGFLESIYEHAMMLELPQRGLEIQRQVEVIVLYNGVEIGKHRLDLVVDGSLVVELKAVQHLDKVHYCVVRSYLKAMRQRHGLLLNFAAPTLEIKRIYNNHAE